MSRGAPYGYCKIYPHVYRTAEDQRNQHLAILLTDAYDSPHGGVYFVYRGPGLIQQLPQNGTPHGVAFMCFKEWHWDMITAICLQTPVGRAPTVHHWVSAIVDQLAWSGLAPFTADLTEEV